MTNNNFLDNLSVEDSDLNSRIINLILGRVFKKVYVSLDEESRKQMENVFCSGSEEEKQAFIKNSIPNLKTLFKEEGKNIEQEIKEEIEKQI